MRPGNRTLRRVDGWRSDDRLRPSVLLGIDVVSRSRFSAAVERTGERLGERILTEAERRWCGADAQRAIVCFALKECVIKAAGGRPEGFRWSDVDAAPRPVPSSIAGAADELRRALLDASVAAGDGSTGVTVIGPLAGAIGARLGRRGDAVSAAGVSAAGVWVQVGDVVIAGVVVTTPD